MPVEIKELVIRATATRERKDIEDLGDDPEDAYPAQASYDTQAIVQECVQQVLRILRKEKER
jgi:hypothetical protein